MIGRKTTGCAGAVMSIQIRRGAEPSGRYSGAPGSSSNTTPAISTSSPGSKPAASSARITPSRCRRRSTCASASSFSRSWRAIRRSTASPVTRNAPVAEALDLELARRRRAEDAVLGELVLAGARRHRARRPARAGAARARARRGPRGWRRGDEHGPASAPRTPRAAAPRSAPPLGGGLGLLGVTRSALDSARMRGSAASRGSCSASSRSIIAWFSTGSEPSSGARSSTWTSSRVRSTWARKSWPRPGAVARALDQPGDVGDHELAVGGLERAEVRLQRRERVAGDLGLRAGERAQISDDLPALGSPTSPTSASSLRCSSTMPSSPSRPFSASRGAWRVGAREPPVAAPADAAAGDVTSWPGTTRS